jgi:type III pantothenate kinase
MTKLVLDIGNSSVKLAVFKDKEIIYQETSLTVTEVKLQELIQGFEITHSIVSTVRQEQENISSFLQQNTQFIRFSHQTSLPIHNHYQSPETLGLDRLSALMGAKKRFPQTNVLVIDAGTCITCDLLDREANYTGGSISPGIHMRFKALETFTGKLPLVPFEPSFNELVGKNTKESILSGVVNGVVHEITGFIEDYQQKYPDLRVLLCGGDAVFFDTRLKNSIFAHIVSTEPDLVLIGLNEIIHHQYDE